MQSTEAIAQLADVLAHVRRILVFTGAGLSTASGIPDFRGPKGVWKRRQPVYYEEFLASAAKRLEYWDYKEEGYDAFMAACPNAAHHAITRLDQAGRVERVVTQNIDGLHSIAGLHADRIVELHGTNRFVECVRCHARQEPAAPMQFFRKERLTPQCACGGWLKFATISFGQSLDPATLDAAERAAERADCALSVGSSLSVYPAAAVPLAVVRRGCPYAIVNQGPTDHDDVASLRIEGNVIDILPAAVDRVLADRPRV